jgi:hypothetical protein
MFDALLTRYRSADVLVTFGPAEAFQPISFREAVGDASPMLAGAFRSHDEIIGRTPFAPRLPRAALRVR